MAMNMLFESGEQESQLFLFERDDIDKYISVHIFQLFTVND